MKITVHRFELPLRHTFRISRGASDVQETIVVELEEDGFKGYGESTTNDYYKVTSESLYSSLMSAPLPKTWSHPSEVWSLLDSHFGENYFARNALDAAYYDLWGKKLGKPVYELLGLTLDTCPYSDYTIGIDNIPKMVEKMLEFDGWPIYKIKLGSDNDLAIVRELRKHTNAIFRVDANCGWSAKQTIEYSHALKELNVEFIEQPMPPALNNEMPSVIREAALPIIADESCVVEADVDKSLECFDGINIKLTKCGGITPALRMIKKAREAGKKVMAGCMTESTVGISAIGQILPLLDYVDMDGAILLKEDVADGVKLEKGKAIFPSTNGNGLTLLRHNVYKN